ncbi:hypothetical protein [Streptomyces sp. NPDC051546]|uniref:hypothetical protein n=1 Tax=Streptomyces sp. NPDC051546 TaxID=3365655 RepID=UPI0037AE9BEF
MAQTFATLADRNGGGQVRVMLAAYLNEQLPRLLHAPAPLHARLLSGATQLTHLLAAMNDDSGHPGLAQRYFHTALDLAQQAHNPRLYAITLRALSTQALRLGQPRHALDLAEAALHTLAAGTDPGTEAFLLIQRAHAQAVNGHHREAVADLTAAERRHTQLDDTPGPFHTYPRAALDYQRAQTLAALGDVSNAVHALGSSLHHRDPAQRKSRLLTHARLAELHLASGHVEEGTLHGRHFLEGYPLLRSTHADTALHHLNEHLTRYPHQPHATRLVQHLSIARTPHRPRTGN